MKALFLLFILSSLLIFSCNNSPVENRDEAFITTWDTTKEYLGFGEDNLSTEKEIKISSGGFFSFDYDYNIDCDDDGFYDAEGVSGDYTCEYDKPGIYTIVITGKYPRFDVSYDCSYVDDGRTFDTRCSDINKLISVDQWGTQKWESMESMFEGSDVIFNATDTPSLSNVKTMSKMFKRASVNIDISSWDISNVKDISYMFRGALFNQDISNWNVSNVRNMEGLFQWSSFNQSLKNWDVSNVENMSYMFDENRMFNQALNNWDVSSVKTMKNMFSSTDSFNNSSVINSLTI